MKRTHRILIAFIITVLTTTLGFAITELLSLYRSPIPITIAVTLVALAGIGIFEWRNPERYINEYEEISHSTGNLLDTISKRFTQIETYLTRLQQNLSLLVKQEIELEKSLIEQQSQLRKMRKQLAELTEQYFNLADIPERLQRYNPPLYESTFKQEVTNTEFSTRTTTTTTTHTKLSIGDDKHNAPELSEVDAEYLQALAEYGKKPVDTLKLLGLKSKASQLLEELSTSEKHLMNLEEQLEPYQLQQLILVNSLDDTLSESSSDLPEVEEDESSNHSEEQAKE